MTTCGSHDPDSVQISLEIQNQKSNRHRQRFFVVEETRVSGKSGPAGPSVRWGILSRNLFRICRMVVGGSIELGTFCPLSIIEQLNLLDA